MEKEAIRYAKDLKIPVSESYLRKIILSHPDYPSIVSVADAFSGLGIECVAAQKAIEELDEVEFPYLLHADPFYIEYVRSREELNKARQKYPKLSGIVIKIEATDVVADPVHKRYYDRERLMRSTVIVMASLFAALVLIPVPSGITVFSGLLALAAIAGVSIVVMLKIREYGLSWEKLEAFCHAGPNADCDSVISSEGSKIFGTVTLTNIALSYFMWQLVALAVVSAVPAFESVVRSAIYLAAAGAVAVVGYSVMYQWRVVGKWCKFCLLLGGVCLAQLGVIVALDPHGYNADLIRSVSPYGFVVLLFLFAFLVAVFTIVTIMHETSETLSESDIYQKRIFNSPAVFFEALRNEPSMTMKSSDEDIVIGNPDAAITITAALNVLCKPCKDAFAHIYEFIAVHGDNARVVLRFNAGSPMKAGDLSVDEYLVRYWMSHIKGIDTEAVDTLEFFDTWYKTMDFSRLNKVLKDRNGVPMEQVRSFIDANTEWMRNNPISETPTFFFNDKRIPRAYRIKELTSAFGLIISEMPESPVLDQVEV